MNQLPPLPHSNHNTWPHGFHDLYTAEQMQAYGQACWDAAIKKDEELKRLMELGKFLESLEKL